MTYVQTAQNNKSVTCSCVPSYFYFVLQTKLAGRVVQNYENWSFFSVFSSSGPVTQVFGQVKEWLILEPHEIVGLLLLQLL